MTAPLTLSEVLAILSAAAVDTSRLEFRQDPDCVAVFGPEQDRWEASGVLFAAGLAQAMYGDHDIWLHRQEPGA